MKKSIHLEYEVIQKENFSTEEQKLYLAASEIRKKAYAKYSHFAVGCALLMEDGNIVVGNNQENAAFPSGTCAERSAIFWAKSNFPNLKVLSIFIIGGPEDDSKSVITSPCGACRQSLLQYEIEQNKNITLYFSSYDGNAIKVNSIQHLLPFSFDGSEL